jgi:glycosyltransferase involved in cell wall biosynthesis
VRVAVDILPGLAAGVGRWQRETIRALTQSPGGPVREVTAFSFGKRFLRPDWMPPTARYRASWLPGRVQRVLNDPVGWPVERVCQLGQPDVILGMNLLPLRARAPVVVAVADVSWRRFASQYRAWFTPRQIQQAERAIRVAARILTLSRYSADELASGGVPEDRITVAPLGVGEEFRAVEPPEVARIRATYRLPDRFVLYVGGINERKNVRVLVAAMNAVRWVAPLVLAGPPPVESLAYWGLDQPGVRHLGYVPDADVPGLYAAASVKVFPSKLEGYGLPLVEAMAVGTPVLAADTPVFREVAGTAACFFPPDDSAGLADLIGTAVSSAAFRDEYGARGKAHAAHCTWAAYGDLLVQCLQTACRLPRSRHKEPVLRPRLGPAEAPTDHRVGPADPGRSGAVTTAR